MPIDTEMAGVREKKKRTLATTALAPTRRDPQATTKKKKADTPRALFF